MLLKYFLVFSILFSAYSTSAKQDENYGDIDKSMTFKSATTGGNCSFCSWTSAIGVIDESTPQKFKEYFKKNPYTWDVYLHSPGGSLKAGMELGKLFRENKIATNIGKTYEVDNYTYEETSKGVCASACAYAFMGGASRSILEGSEIGLHQFYQDSENATTKIKDFSNDQAVSGILAEYLVSMGIDARILTLASIAGKNDMLSLNEIELIGLKVITRQGYEPLEIKSMGNGILAYMENYDVNHQVREISTSCLNDKSLIFRIGLKRFVHDNSFIEKGINQIELTTNDSFHGAVIPKENWEVVNIGQTTNIMITIPRTLQKLILNENSFSFSVNAPNSLFRPSLNEGFEVNANTKKKLSLAWKNCI